MLAEILLHASPAQANFVGLAVVAAPLAALFLFDMARRRIRG